MEYTINKIHKNIKIIYIYIYMTAKHKHRTYKEKAQTTAYKPQQVC